MKKKASKELIAFIIIIPLFLLGSFYLSTLSDDKLPSYSIINKSNKGSSVFFETLKEFNYPVERTLKSIDNFDTDSIHIVADTGNFNINDENVKSWVYNGGILVHLTTGNLHLLEYGKVDKGSENITLYHYGQGLVIGSDAIFISNRELLKNKGGAYELLKEIDGHVFKKIYFNEAHMYAADANKKSLWDFVPREVKVIMYQLLLILAAVLFYKGKRFGKVVPLYEEEERIENEYMYSAASLYKQAKCYDLIVESYYRELLRKLNCSHEDFINCFEKENIQYINKARKVYNFMNKVYKNPKTKIKAKEYIQNIATIDQLTGIVKKRRDSYWKALKKTQ
ncbi:hypothetical protein [Clostridium omnivorum]|uniref:DUF4350 domain-containing protein n=1 Tax=Clostridium omnivorum TaxID=1604902 RepID=A0ABQ5N782_9CLOT|nr:hypothetical protein [Clostridium sp. E14]GLC31094.1 hypothetical protein bsdE14_25040 [Clostridium sp. E14]